MDLLIKSRIEADASPLIADNYNNSPFDDQSIGQVLKELQESAKIWQKVPRLTRNAIIEALLPFLQYLNDEESKDK